MVLEFEGESNKDLTQDLIEVTWLIIWLTAVTFGGYFSLTAGGAFEEDINRLKFFLFTGMMVMFAIYALAIKFAQRFGTFQNFYVPIFDPEKGFFPIKSGLKFLLVTSLIIVSLAFIISFQPQSTIANFVFPLQVGIAEQQTTPGAKILFGFYNSPAENAFLYIILGFLVTFELVLFTKITPLTAKTIFIIFLIPNTIIGSVAWLQIHDLVSCETCPAEPQ